MRAHELLALRQELGRRYSELLARRLDFEPLRTRAELLQLRAGGVQRFELVPRDGYHETALTRGRAYVFPLLPQQAPEGDELGTPRAWVGWIDKWRCIGRDHFDLELAAWTVYWGYPNDELKAQVVRAEWDRAYRLDNAPSNTGHPHWHFDGNVPFFGEAPASDRDALVEIVEAVPRQLAMERVHLAMGGWLNNARLGRVQPDVQANDGMPGCWQHEFRGSPDEVSKWGVRTLRYLQSQGILLRVR